MKTELKKNLPIDIYHSDNGFISASQLKLILKSPLHFKHPQAYSSPALDIGSAVHTMILEPFLFDKLFFTLDDSKRPVPESDYKKKENKEWKQKILVENEGKTILTVEQLEQCRAMSERVLSDPLTKELLEGPGWNEASIFWMDYKRKVKLKSRPDRITKNMVIVDLKTAQDASPAGFERAIGNFRYDIQAATQIDAVQQHFKKKVEYYIYIAIEKTPPYAYGIYVLQPDTIWQGRNTYKSLLDIYNECKEKNEWPAYNYWAKEFADKFLRTKLPEYTKTALFQH